MAAAPEPSRAAAGGFWRLAGEGAAVRVRVQPRARRAGLGGIGDSADGWRLRVAVSEPPEAGRANAAACAALAEALGVAKGAVAVTQGAGAREKTLCVAGDPARLAARLRELEALRPRDLENGA